MAQVIPIPQAPRQARLICSACGASGEASCHCGAPYVAIGVRASEAVKANPGKSDRLIADEIGVSDWTVRKARKATARDHAVEKRIGKDGKARRLPRAPEPPPDAAEQELEHIGSALLIHAGQAFDLAQMFRASLQRAPLAVTGETIEAVRRSAETWTSLAAEIEEKS